MCVDVEENVDSRQIKIPETEIPWTKTMIELEFLCQCPQILLVDDDENIRMVLS